MFRLFGLLLVGLVLAAGQAMAQDRWNGRESNPQITGKIRYDANLMEAFTCERTSIGGSGWVTGVNLEKIWPKKISVKYSDFTEVGMGFKSMIHVEEHLNGYVQSFRLLPNKTAIGSIKAPHGFATPGDARYICEISSIQLRALLEGSGFTPPVKFENQEQAEQQPKQQNSINDINAPTITVTSARTTGLEGLIKGRVNSLSGLAALRMDGEPLQFDSNGNFSGITYVPDGGINVSIEAVDLAGLTSSMSVRLDRLASTAATTVTFDRLNPLGRKVSSNSNSLALIIGVDSYKSTPARAMYADSDAKVFSDYASQKLGIPTSRIKTLVNDGAGERELLLSVKSWLSRSVKQDQSDVYIFFAGHGLASDDGSKMYLLPYDGAPELLDKTAILRDELFADISAANPRSVTVFLDTCYSGTTRGTDMLIASRPIAIRALEQSIPDNFTVMTAAAGDQTAKPLEEAKHGMFSYFLMKGMEGDADANNDNEITAGELHSYVQTNVIQQSSGSQTPELQGDADRVLVRFQ